MNEKPKKPKRKQITVDPFIVGCIHTLYGKYVEQRGYISLGKFCDLVIEEGLVTYTSHLAETEDEDRRSSTSPSNGESKS